MKPSGGTLRDQVILVTGGAGFLGVHVAQALVQRRARLVLQDNAPKRSDLLTPVLASRRADFVVCDLAEFERAGALLERLPEVDYLVHLGLSVPPSLSADPTLAAAQYQTANLGPFAGLLARLPARLKGVCLASSVSVYGMPEQQPVTESAPTRNTAPYATAKLAMEAALADYGARRAVPVTTLRFSTLYGPGEIHSPRAIPSFMRALLAGHPPVIFGDGTDVHDYLYVTDAAEGVCQALEHQAAGGGVYNVASGHGWTTRAIAESVQRIVGLALPPKHMPARGPRQTLVADITRARAELEFEPSSTLEQGLADELAYFRSHMPAHVEAARGDESHGLFVRNSVQPAGR